MQYSEGRIGRIFTLRLDTGDRLPDTIESFALEHGISRAMVIYVGGSGEKSRVVVGPEEGPGEDIVPMVYSLTGRQEVIGVGTIFPKESGEPVLHMHAGMGREGNATVGCVRAGVNVWLVGEVVILELLGTGGRRIKEKSGFELLQFEK